MKYFIDGIIEHGKRKLMAARDGEVLRFFPA
jgi:hypothetical protein